MLAALMLSFAATLPIQELDARGQQPVLLQIHDVSDLAERMGPEFPARKIGTSRPVGSKSTAEGGVPVLADIPVLGSLFTNSNPKAASPEHAAQIAAGTRLIESTVRRHLTPQLSDPHQSLGSTQAGSLVFNGTRAQHEWLKDFLQNLRSYDKLIEVEARFVRVPGERLKELGIEGTSVFPKPEDMPTLLQALKQTPKVEFMSAPRVLALPLQRASISVLDTIRFVADWRVETVEPGAQEVLVPEIEELETGLALDVRAVPLPGEKLALTLEAQDARLARPLVSLTEKLKTKKGEIDVSIALPEVSIQRVQTELLLQDGSTAVLVVDPSSSKDRLVILVTARSVAAK